MCVEIWNTVFIHIKGSCISVSLSDRNTLKNPSGRTMVGCHTVLKWLLFFFLWTKKTFSLSVAVLQSSGSSLLAVVLDPLPQASRERLQARKAGVRVQDSCHYGQDDFKGCQTSAHSSEYWATVLGLTWVGYLEIWQKWYNRLIYRLFSCWKA